MTFVKEIKAIINQPQDYYKLDLPNTLKIHPVFHISLLKPYYESPETFNRTIPPTAEIIIENDIPHEEYEVEKILDVKTYHKRKHYLILWKGYPLHDATWEPIKNLTHCQDLLKEFYETRTFQSK